MLSRSLLLRLMMAVCLVSGTSNFAQAQVAPYFQSDALTYQGTWTSYSTNPIGSPFATQTGSGSIGTTQLWAQMGGDSDPATYFIATPFTLPPPGIFAINLKSDGSDQPFNTSFWNTALTEYTTQQIGSTTGGDSYFDPKSVGGGPDEGNWVYYNFQATLTGLNGIGSPPSDTNAPTGAYGFLKGVFQNTGPGGDGLFYAVDFQVGFGSGGVPLPGTGNSFGSNLVIPEPTSCVAFAMMFAASAGYGWRRRKQRLTLEAPAAV
ncbi:MAG: hypothetical protein WCL32_21365 [Planctomycetota bacterium]